MGPVEGTRINPREVVVGGVGTGIPQTTLKVVRGFFSIIWAALTGKIHSKELLLTDTTSGTKVTYKTTVYVLKESARECLRGRGLQNPSSKHIQDWVHTVGRLPEVSAKLERCLSVKTIPETCQQKVWLAPLSEIGNFRYRRHFVIQSPNASDKGEAAARLMLELDRDDEVKLNPQDHVPSLEKTPFTFDSNSLHAKTDRIKTLQDEIQRRGPIAVCLTRRSGEKSYIVLDHITDDGLITFRDTRSQGARLAVMSFDSFIQMNPEHGFQVSPRADVSQRRVVMGPPQPRRPGALGRDAHGSGMGATPAPIMGAVVSPSPRPTDAQGERIVSSSGTMVEVKRPPGMEKRTGVSDLNKLDSEYNKLKLCPIDISTFEKNYAPLRIPRRYAGTSSLSSGDNVQDFLLRVYADNKNLFQAGIPAHSLATEEPARSTQMAFWTKLAEIHSANETH